MRRVEISVYCKFMMLLFLLAASYDGRGIVLARKI